MSLSAPPVEEFRKRVKLEGFTPDQRDDADFFAIVLDQLPDTEENYDLIQRGYEIFLEQSEETDPEFYTIVDLFETRLGYEPLRPRSSNSSRRIDADEFWLDIPVEDFRDPYTEFEDREGFPGFTGTGYVNRVLSVISSIKAFGWSYEVVEQILAIAARNLITDPNYSDDTPDEFMRLYGTGELNPFDKLTVAVDFDESEAHFVVEPLFFLILLYGRTGIVRVLLKKDTSAKTQPDALAIVTLDREQDNWELVKLLLKDGRFDPNQTLTTESASLVHLETDKKYIPLLRSLDNGHYRSILALVSDSRTNVSIDDNIVLLSLFNTWNFENVKDLELDRRGLPKIKAQLLVKIVTHPKFQAQNVLIKLVETEHGLSLHYLKIILNVRNLDVTASDYEAIKAAIRQMRLPIVELLLTCPQVFLPDAFDLFSYVDVLISENQRNARKVRDQYQMLRQIREQIREDIPYEFTKEDYDTLSGRAMSLMLVKEPERTLIVDNDSRESFYLIPEALVKVKAAAFGYEALKPDVQEIFSIGDRYMDFMDVITTSEQAEQWYDNDEMSQLDSVAYNEYEDVKESLSDKRQKVIEVFLEMLHEYRNYQENIVNLFKIRDVMDKLRDKQFDSIQVL